MLMAEARGTEAQDASKVCEERAVGGVQQVIGGS